MDTINKQFLNLSRNEQKAVIEALLFSSEEPMPAKLLYRTLVITGSGFNAYKPEITPEETKVDEKPNLTRRNCR